MSVDLSKNKTSILEAYHNVISDHSPTDWFLLGYEGTSNVLKVIGQGDGGLQELLEDLNAGKVLYGFFRVVDSKTQLAKFVLLHWQGEASPNSRRAVSASHLLEVGKLLKGASIQVAATNEDDIDEDKIVEKLSKIATDYKLLKGTVSDKPQIPSPVKTAPPQKRPPQKLTPPQKIVPPPAPEMEKPRSPSKLISPFLNKTEEPLSSPVRQAQNGSENGASHVNKMRAMFNSPAQPESPTKTSSVPKFSKINQQKAMFERGMLGEETHQAKKPIDIQKEIEDAQQQQKMNQPPTLNATVAEKEEKTIEPNGGQIEQDIPEQTPTIAEHIDQEVPTNEAAVVYEEEFIDAEQTLQARALYDYQAADETEISFDPGDIITHIDQIDEGWWQGLAPDGKTYGLFPANYVELIQ